MITKSDLQAIAGVLKGLKPDDERPQRSSYHTDALYWGAFVQWGLWVDMVKAFANMLSSNNPRFQYAKFYKACQYEETAP